MAVVLNAFVVQSAQCWEPSVKVTNNNLTVMIIACDGFQCACNQSE